jgi:hypothetical protein
MLVNYHKYSFELNTNGNNTYAVNSAQYLDNTGTIQIITFPSGPMAFSSVTAIADALQAIGCRITPKVRYKENKLTIQLESFFIFHNIGYVFTDNGIVDYDFVNANEISSAYKSNHMVVRGCTDDNAMNFVPQATEDDGSCVYAPISAITILRRKTNLFNHRLIHRERLGEKVCCCEHSISKYLLKVLTIADDAFNNDVLLQEEIRSKAVIDLTILPKDFFQNGMELELIVVMPNTTNELSIASFPTNYYGKGYPEIATLISQAVNANSDDYFCVPNIPSSGKISIYSPSGEAELFNGAILKIQKNQAYGFVEKKDVFTSLHHFTDAIYINEAPVPFFYGGDSDNNSVFSFYFDSDLSKQQVASDAILLPEKIIDLDTQNTYEGAFRGVGERYNTNTANISSLNLAKNQFAISAYSFDKLYTLESTGVNTKIVQYGPDGEEDSFLFTVGYDTYICCNQNDGNLFCFNINEGKLAIVIHNGFNDWKVTLHPIAAPIGDPTHGRPVFNKDMNHVLFPYEGIIYCLDNTGFIARQILMKTHDLYSLTVLNNIDGSVKGIVMNALYNYNTRIEKYSANYLTMSTHNAPIKIIGYTSVLTHSDIGGDVTVIFVDYDNDVCNFSFDTNVFTKVNLYLPEPNSYSLIGFSGSDNVLSRGIQYHYLNVKISTPDGDYVRMYSYNRQKRRGIIASDLRGLCTHVFKHDDSNPLITMTRFFDDYIGNIIIWDFFNTYLGSFKYGSGGGEQTVFHITNNLVKAYGLLFSTSNPFPSIPLEAGYRPEGMQVQTGGASEAYMFLSTDSNEPILMQFGIDDLSGLSAQKEIDPTPYLARNGSYVNSVTKIAGGNNKIYVVGEIDSGEDGFVVCRESENISVITTTQPVDELIYTHQQNLLLVVIGTQLFAYDEEGLNPQPILNNEHDFTGHEVNAYYDRGADIVLLVDVDDNRLFIVNMVTLSMDGEINPSLINNTILLKKAYHDFNGTVIYASYQDPGVQRNGFAKFDLVDGITIDLNATFSQGQDAVYENDADKCLPLSTVQTMVDNSLQLLRNCDI